MSTDNREFIQLQIESLFYRYFMVLYDDLEKLVKKVFENGISSISSEKREILYFYLASIKSNKIQADFGDSSFTTTKVQYTRSENFNIFTANQIIKLQREYAMLEVFNFNIVSINSRSSEYPFCDCFLKLLSMRNKLAHESGSLIFKDKDFIELLSNDYISQHSSEWINDMDCQLMTDNSKCIFSNIVFMQRILDQLRKRAEENDQAVDS